jgi:hypothetical protein
MTKFFAAVALSIALPAMGHAQSPAPAKAEAKKDCCAEMKAMKDCCCDKMKQGDAAHADHAPPAATPAPHAH